MEIHFFLNKFLKTHSFIFYFRFKVYNNKSFLIKNTINIFTDRLIFELIKFII